MQRLLTKTKQTPKQLDDAIQLGKDLEDMMKHKGWKHIEAFMAQARIGTHTMMEKEVQAVNSFTAVSLIGAYAKYLMLLFENRAYNKIKTYVSVSIANARKYESDRSRRDKAKESAK